MRLTFVSETYPPEINGVALTVKSLAQQCQALGHRVSVVRPKRDGIELPERTTIVDVCVRAGKLPKYPELRFGFPNYRLLQQHYLQFKPDAVYIATEGPLGWSASIAAKRLGIPVISGFHTRFDTYMGHYGLSWLKGLAFRYLRAFHRRSKLTIVPTDELRSELIEKGLHNVLHIPRGVDTARFDPIKRSSELRRTWGADDSTPVVIHVGRLAPEKNLSLLLSSFRRCKQSSAAARLVMVGDGPLRERLERENPDVIFTGTLTGEALSQAYASADVFALSSLSETFGNVTLEAMASGLAIVAFDYGAARAHVIHGVHGSTVPFKLENAFANALSFEIARWGMGARVGVAAREAAMRLNPQALAQEFLLHLATIIHPVERRYVSNDSSFSEPDQRTSGVSDSKRLPFSKAAKA
jgi:glycosyltransferase involved in cell wall biosynthesis